jgi:hypothetical protein
MGKGGVDGIDPIWLALALAGGSLLGVNSMLQNFRTWFSQRKKFEYAHSRSLIVGIAL